MKLDPKEGAPPQATRRLCILIGDDDRDAAFELMMLLRDQGHDVHAVHAGQYVMSSVIDVNPDAVLLAVNLAYRSGWGIALSIRRQRGHKTPKIIGVGQRTSDKIVSRIIGFDHCLVKPYDPSTLLT